jgi:hypothetical protein
MSKNILFCSRNDIVKRTPLGANIDPDKIVPFIKIAQDKNMLILLGTVLYEYLQTQIAAGTVTGQYQVLLDDYITDTLVHYSMVEALPYLAYTFANGSVVRNNNSEQGTATSKNDLDFLLQKELQTASFYAERLVSYLVAQNTLYPQYTATNGFSDNVYPNKGQQYNRGWVL